MLLYTIGPMADTEDFEALLGQFEQTHADAKKGGPQVGDKVSGVIVSIGRDHAYVSLGAKSEGVIEIGELTDADGQLTAAVGDTVQSVVTGKDEATDMLLLGSQHGRRMHGSAELEQAFEDQLPVEGQVSGVTKGGVEVQIAGVRAFCPASQIDLHYVEDLESFVGQRLAFRITSYQGGRHINLVVSRRALLEQEQQARAEQLRAQLEVGAVLPGTVTSLQDYGAFVDLGGVEGMIHISELAFGRVKHPNEVLSVGQPVHSHPATEHETRNGPQSDHPNQRPEHTPLTEIPEDPGRRSRQIVDQVGSSDARVGVPKHTELKRQQQEGPGDTGHGGQAGHQKRCQQRQPEPGLHAGLRKTNEQPVLHRRISHGLAQGLARPSCG